MKSTPKIHGSTMRQSLRRQNSLASWRTSDCRPKYPEMKNMTGMMKMSAQQMNTVAEKTGSRPSTTYHHCGANAM